MERSLKTVWVMMTAIMTASIIAIGCGKHDYSKINPIPLAIEPLDVPAAPPSGGGNGNTGNTGTQTGSTPFVDGNLGKSIPISLFSSFQDATGLTIATDYDGDGIANDVESRLGSNPFECDYPRVTIQTQPARMEIVYTASGETKRYSEDISSTDVTSKSNESMDETHYSKLNAKTTPYVVKESSSDAGSSANAYGYSNSNEMSFENKFNFAYAKLWEVGAAIGATQKTSKSENWSFSNSFNRSSMSERTVFDDVNYRDNMDSNGITLNESKVKEMVNKYKQSEIASNTISYGPNAGVVETSMTFKNESIDKPVKISNVRCTLLLKQPSGRLEALQTFLLKDRDGYPFEVEIGGGDTTPEYAVVVDGLNTEKIKQALRNGYIPVISVFSYDMTSADDSYYQPGVSNLKQVEEAAKGRTAVIKITAPNKRELHRVVAFDVDNGALVPGISLKKALFNIFRSPLRGGERYDIDIQSKEVTVGAAGLWWHASYAGRKDGLAHEYLYSANRQGNDWDYFATEVKSYTDEFNNVKYIETIKRIGNERDAFGNYITAKYNPFKDNKNYDENEPLPESELLKTKYWIILHNGKFFEGDINDPIWPGDRYEIVLYNLAQFQEHYTSYVYSPLQSGDLLRFDTRWNAKVDTSKELARSSKLGTVMKGDVVRLDVWLKESRFLFDQSQEALAGPGIPYTTSPGSQASPKAWWNFNYTFEPMKSLPNGIPQAFTHAATGGVNNVNVAIENSRYAHYYMIELLDLLEANAIPRRVKVSADDVVKNGGEVHLHSKVLDYNGNQLGTIRGSNYKVTVFAHGVNYGQPSKTPSGSNFALEAEIRVIDATAENPSPNFNFSAQNLYRNMLHVRIPDWPNTEYFIIRCKGPFNYGMGSQVKEVRGHAGLNIVDFDHPYMGIDEAREPGVYEVQVFAVNKNGYDASGELSVAIGASESRLGAMQVNVDYRQYDQQRVVAPFKYVPESELAGDSTASAKSFDLNAVDLEVNFNEGSGWWRLKLSNDDQGPRFTSELRREIDCRFTSIVEDYENQHFVIYFKPPAGDLNQYLNVFRSSDNMVDVYIRTVAEKKYRDTFWIKKMSMIDQYQPGVNSIVTGPLVGNFISFWSQLDGTDASRFEESLAAWRIAAPEALSGLVGIIENAVTNANFFFSPLEQRTYYLSAQIATPHDYVINTPARLDLPKFSVAPGPSSIYVNGIESRYADNYEIWWRRFDRTVTYGDLTMESVGWNDETNQPLQRELWGGPVYATMNDDGICNYQIPDLDANQNYVVAVVGKNTAINGTSKVSFAFDKNVSGDNIQFIVPYPSTPPSTAPTMDIAVNGRTINLSNIQVADQCRYIIRWCEVVDGVDGIWRSFDTYKNNNKTISFDPVSYAIANLNPASTYKVQVYAITMNDLTGPVNEQTATTGIDGTIMVKQKWVTEPNYRVEGIYLSKNGVSNAVMTLPEGTATYRIYGKTTYQSISTWLCLRSQCATAFDSGRIAATQTTVPILSLSPVHVYWVLGIFSGNAQSYDSFTTTYSVEAYNVNGVRIGTVTNQYLSY